MSNATAWLAFICAMGAGVLTAGSVGGDFDRITTAAMALGAMGLVAVPVLLSWRHIR